MSAEPSAEPQDAAPAEPAPVADLAQPAADPPQAVEEPPTAEPPAPAADPRLVIKGANMTVGSASVNGLVVQQLSCKTGKMPMFGTMALIGAIAKKKSALAKCSPKGDAVIVHFTSTGGLLKQVTAQASTSNKSDACIAKVLKKVKAPFPATCAGVLLVGKSDGAEAAAKALSGG